MISCISYIYCQYIYVISIAFVACVDSRVLHGAGYAGTRICGAGVRTTEIMRVG